MLDAEAQILSNWSGGRTSLDIVATPDDPSQYVTELEKAKFVMIGGQAVRDEFALGPVESR